MSDPNTYDLESLVLCIDGSCSGVDRASIAVTDVAGLERHRARCIRTDSAVIIVWGDTGKLSEEHTAAWAALLESDSEKALASLHGPWALAAAFADDRELFAIDRLGRIPLYISTQGDKTQASPDCSALTTANAEHLRIDPDALYTYVYHHMIPAPFALARGVRKLRAGEMLVLPGQSSSTHWHWFPAFSEPKDFDLRAASDDLRVTLKSAVGRCLFDDRKSAAFLSGGLDSSTVAGYLSELTGRDCDAYSIGFDAPGYDEMEYARITAQHFGIRLHEYYVTPDDVMQALPDLATAFAEPFGNSSALPAYFCAKRAAADGVEVMLAGDGGDELFAGNERYAKQSIFERYLAIPGVLRNAIEGLTNLLPSALPLAEKAHSFLRQVNTPMPHRLFYYSFLEQHAPETMFSTAFLRSIDASRPQQELAITYGRAAGASALNQMLNLDWQVTLADNDLRKVNGACAHAGVEVRYPMLDDGLLDLSLRIPTAQKLRGDDLRYFFRSALTGWLPEATINKSKQGFGLPFGVWMREYAPLRDFAYDTVHALDKRQLLKTGFIDDTIAQHRNGHASYYGELLWILCTLELWLAGHYPEFRCD